MKTSRPLASIVHRFYVLRREQTRWWLKQELKVALNFDHSSAYLLLFLTTTMSATMAMAIDSSTSFLATLTRTGQCNSEVYAYDNGLACSLLTCHSETELERRTSLLFSPRGERRKTRMATLSPSVRSLGVLALSCAVLHMEGESQIERSDRPRSFSFGRRSQQC